jgi:hypothetical protein
VLARLFEQLHELELGPTRAQHTEPDDRARVRQKPNQHVLRPGALLAFEMGEGCCVEPLARRVGILKEAESEALKCG